MERWKIVYTNDEQLFVCIFLSTKLFIKNETFFSDTV